MYLHHTNSVVQAMAPDAPWPTTDAIFGPPSLALISGVAMVPSVYTSTPAAHFRLLVLYPRTDQFGRGAVAASRRSSIPSRSRDMTLIWFRGPKALMRPIAHAIGPPIIIGGPHTDGVSANVLPLSTIRIEYLTRISVTTLN